MFDLRIPTVCVLFFKHSHKYLMIITLYESGMEAISVHLFYIQPEVLAVISFLFFFLKISLINSKGTHFKNHISV